MRKPAIGNLVRTKDLNDHEATGVVDWIGASQFAFNGADGSRYMVKFDGSITWEVVKVVTV